MNKIVFATQNKNKVKEINELLDTEKFQIITLAEIGYSKEIEEPYFTFHENAKTKAQTIHNEYKKPCFAEDSGLIIPAINNEPGVWSSRYSGENATDIENIEKVLGKMKNISDRFAFFTTIICFVDDQNIVFFEGKCKGTISLEPKGNKGFGYDPIFIPENKSTTFAEMNLDEKQELSHRTQAFLKFKEWILSTNI